MKLTWWHCYLCSLSVLSYMVSWTSVVQHTCRSAFFLVWQFSSFWNFPNVTVVAYTVHVHVCIYTVPIEPIVYSFLYSCIHVYMYAGWGGRVGMSGCVLWMSWWYDSKADVSIPHCLVMTVMHFSNLPKRMPKPYHCHCWWKLVCSFNRTFPWETPLWLYRLH